jgi:hypothetical protein
MTDVLEHHEHSVLMAMREQIAATPMPAARQRNSGGFVSARPRLLVTATAGVAALAAAMVLIFAGASSPPAYAVATNANGTTTITLNALSAVDALNNRLASAGVHVRVAPAVEGCDAPVQLAGSTAPPATLKAEPGSGASSIQLSATAAPAPGTQGLTDVPAGQTLVLAATQTGLQAVGQIDQDTAPACVGLAS